MGFVKGMDVSMAKALEAHGASYYLDGKQDDLLEHRAAGKVSGAACLSHEKSTSFLSFTRRSRFPKHCTLLRRTASEM